MLIAQKLGVATVGAYPLTIHPLQVTAVAKRVFTPLYNQHFGLCSVRSSTSPALLHTRLLHRVRTRGGSPRKTTISCESAVPDVSRALSEHFSRTEARFLAAKWANLPRVAWAIGGRFFT